MRIDPYPRRHTIRSTVSSGRLRSSNVVLSVNGGNQLICESNPDAVSRPQDPVHVGCVVRKTHATHGLLGDRRIQKHDDSMATVARAGRGNQSSERLPLGVRWADREPATLGLEVT